MVKMTYDELRETMFRFNEEFPNSTLYGVIVFTEDSFSKPFTETERSYKVSNNNKGFQHGKISNSIYGNCLDGQDLNVRLDWYMYDEKPWKIDYCYLTQEA